MSYPRLVIKAKYKNKKCKSPYVTDSDKAISIIREISNNHHVLWQESMLMLCLYSSNRLQCWSPVSIGGTDFSPADIKIVATIAATTSASKVILAHNHPGGILLPSKSDIKTTHTIAKGLSTIGVELVDHIIFTDEGHISMKDEGYFTQCYN